jgi:glycosyltransferase involved in cell wall biosynthesis
LTPKTSTRPLRIAHVSGHDPLKYGGLERFMVHVARECTARGHRFYGVWESAPASDAFQADFTAAGGSGVVMPSRGRNVVFLAEMARWLRRCKIDVVHTHFNPASLLTLAAARLVRVPVPLCMVHTGFAPGEMQALRFRNLAAIRFRRALAAKVYTCCRTVAAEIDELGLGGRGMEPFYLGVEPPNPKRPPAEVRRELGIAETDLVVVCTAYHGNQKGLDVFMRALAILVPRVPSVRLVQVGGGADTAYSEMLRRLAQELGVSGRITWAGVRNDVADILQCGQVYCQPSRFEGLPLSILEAMGSGLPVVGTDVNGIAEAVVNGVTGLLVEREAPGPLADALQRFLGDAALRRQMGEAGRQRVETMFSMSVQVRLLVDKYEAMIAATRPANL